MPPGLDSASKCSKQPVDNLEDRFYKESNYQNRHNAAFGILVNHFPTVKSTLVKALKEARDDAGISPVAKVSCNS
jgi:hypothetical protein